MFTDSQKRGFTLTELLAVVAIVALLMALTLPSLQAARETYRRNACTGKLKELGQALHAHAEFCRRFPPLTYCNVPGDTTSGGCPAFVNAGCMSTVNPHRPSAASDISPGYSWIVRLLPYLNEVRLSNAIEYASNDFTLAPWDRNVVIRGAAGKGVHPATMPLSALICPSFPGRPTNIDSSPYPRNEYYISNYVALAATNYQRMNRPPYASAMLEPNGVICQNAMQGLPLSAIRDGTSKTFALCESREDNLAVWFDGAVNWGVAVAPDSTSMPPSAQIDGFLGYSFPYRSDVKLSIAQTGNDFTAMKYYMSRGKVAGINDTWLWGPSSAHAGGIVMHVCADGAVRPVPPDIDINTYIRLVTREGKEPQGIGISDD